PWGRSRGSKRCREKKKSRSVLSKRAHRADPKQGTYVAHRSVRLFASRYSAMAPRELRRRERTGRLWLFSRGVVHLFMAERASYCVYNFGASAQPTVVCT